MTDIRPISADPPATPATTLAGRLRQAIEEGHFLDSGRLLPERELAEAMGQGRRSLRQALAQLESEGVIWRRQGQGTFVSALRPPQGDSFGDIATRTSPVELTVVRLEIEPVLARHCALRATPEQLERILRAVQAISAAESAYALASADAAFHRAIAQGANNALFLAMFDTIMAVLAQSDWRAIRQRTVSLARRAEMAAEHDAVVSTLVARDPERAELAMRAHIVSVYARLQAPATLRD